MSGATVGTADRQSSAACVASRGRTTPAPDVDRGLPPRAAHRELWRRAGAAGTTVVAVSRDLVAAVLTVTSGPDPDRSGSAESVRRRGPPGSSGCVPSHQVPAA